MRLDRHERVGCPIDKESHSSQSSFNLTNFFFPLQVSILFGLEDISAPPEWLVHPVTFPQDTSWDDFPPPTHELPNIKCNTTENKQTKRFFIMSRESESLYGQPKKIIFGLVRIPENFSPPDSRRNVGRYGGQYKDILRTQQRGQQNQKAKRFKKALQKKNYSNQSKVLSGHFIWLGCRLHL